MLSRAEFHVLLSLLESDRHGYGIMREVERQTDGQLSPGAGSLYAALQRLQDDGLIEEATSRASDSANGQQAQRRYYALTPRGWDVLRHELRQLDVILERARANPKLRKGLT